MLTSDKIRIGNLIAAGANKDNPKTWVIGKVISISSLDAKFEQIEIETEESFEWFFRDNYFSIPLTKEWLLKLGFKINRITKEENNIWRKEWSEGYFELEEIISFFFGHPTYSVEIKTVDHLQNLYYCITKEELID
jgi:hypothetical protein